jgi:hypothetical protein
MKKFGWPRCFAESAVLWLAFIPAFAVLSDYFRDVDGAFKSGFVWAYPFRDGVDAVDLIPMIYIAFYIVATAGIIRVSRKNLFDQ